jgi:hypothetical protein
MIASNIRKKGKVIVNPGANAEGIFERKSQKTEKGEKRMEETFERIARHFYKRQYQNSTGDWRTSYYALFVTWQGKRQRFSLGDCLEDARDELGRLHTLNKGRYDFNAEKENPGEGQDQGHDVSRMVGSVS